MAEKAYISDIQRFSVHDGPGIRTTVFFLGCPLRCSWCQNPETLKKTPELMINEQLCTVCGACIEACPVGAVVLEEGKIITNRSICTRCGKCAEVCFFGARKMSGRLYGSDEVCEEVLRDEVIYGNTGGGVTLSGGEPLLHPDFVFEVFSTIRKKGYGTAVETCGAVPWKNIKRVLPVTDMLLFDIKLADPDKHLEWTGLNNVLVRQNLKKASMENVKIIPRIPLIPGVNDGASEFNAILDICENTVGADEIHIMPFHQIGSSKYKMLDYEYRLHDKSEENTDQIEFCVSLAEKRGFKVSIGGSGIKTKEDRKPSSDEDWFLYRK